MILKDKLITAAKALYIASLLTSTAIYAEVDAGNKPMVKGVPAVSRTHFPRDHGCFIKGKLAPVGNVEDCKSKGGSVRPVTTVRKFNHALAK